MKFEDDFMFAKPFKSAYLESIDREVYFLNGTAGEHNAFTKLISDDKKRQQGFEKVVYVLACDEKGKPKYNGKITATDFHNNVDRTLARDYGMLILGIKQGDEKSDFDEEVEQEVKNSKQEKEPTTS